MSGNYSNGEVGPDDLCPCGSGKKFKNCCLQKENQQYIYDRIKDRLLQQLFDFLHQQKYWTQVEDLYDYFLQLTDYEQELPEYLYFWFAEIAIFDYSLPGQDNLIDIFLTKKRSKLTSKETELLVGWKQLSLSIYQVEEFTTQQIKLIDLVRNKKFKLPRYRYDIMPGEIVVARIGQVGSQYQIIGSYELLPGDCKEILVNWVEASLTQSVFASETINQFLQTWSSDLIRLIKEIQQSLLEDFPEQLFTGDEIFIAHYQVQSRELASKKLSAQEKIRPYHSDADRDVLLWWADNDSIIKGELFITEEELIFRSYTAEDLTAGKKLIADTLKFIVEFEEDYCVEESLDVFEARGGEEGELLQLNKEKLIEVSVPNREFFSNSLPQELIKTETGRKKIKKALCEHELLAVFTGQDSSYTVEEIDKIREELQLPARNDPLLADEIEKMLAQQMKDEYRGEIICEGIFIWRDFKEKIETIIDNPESWAAAVEYLICRLNHWRESQQEIGEKYGVKGDVVEHKYREISECLKL